MYTLTELGFNAPSFEEVGGAYCFWVVCLFICHGQEQLEIGSWHFITGIRMKSKQTHIFLYIYIFFFPLAL